MAHLIYGMPPGPPGMDEQDLFGDAASVYAAAAAAGLNSADDSLPYSTSELNAAEYSTDEFRMYQFKVARCSKRYVHDWRACPFAHPTENARRRDPRCVKYLPVPCPDYKRGICLRGDSCTYSHGVYECWLHPAKYRTQLCKEGPNCRRPVCFFAHSVLDLRQPSHAMNSYGSGEPAPADAVAASVAAALVQQAAAQQQQQQHAALAAAAASQRLSVDAASFHRLSSEEIMNNMQDGRGSVDGSVAAGLSGSPNGSRASLGRSSSGGMRNGSTGTPSGSPDRAGSPNTPSQRGLDVPAHREMGGTSDAATAMAVLTQQQQAQAAASAAAALAARLSMEGRSSQMMDAHAARASLDAATLLHHQQQQQAAGAGLPPRMSLDSLMATRQAGPGWTPGAVPQQGATAAAALAAGNSALPLNEQPFPSGNAPRMSNAVARKLGLAPQRTSLDARLGKLRAGPGMATPPRTSIDGILAALQQAGSARSSLDQQAAVLQAMNSQQMAAQGLNGLPQGYAPQGAGYGPHPGYGGPPQGYAPQPGADQLHPALLSLVAAQMQGGQQAPMHPNGMQAGLGVQQGREANMAGLVETLNSWQLGQTAGGGSMHHRGSMEGMTAMAAAPPQSMGQPGGGGAYYAPRGKDIWASGSQEALNNQAATES